MHEGEGSGALIVMPTFNEARTLAEMVQRVHGALPGAHVLVIDDASPDGTGEVADHLARDPRVRVMHRSGKLGLGTAYVAGFRIALEDGYSWVIEMDSDASHQPEELERLLAAAREGAGLVIGTRWMAGGDVQGWPRYRRWISRTGTRVARAALRSRLLDITSGFRLIERSWLARLDLDGVTSQGYGFQVETAWTLERFGCPIAEVPMTFTERAAGRSKMSVGIVFEALGRVLGWGWKLRFAPERLPSVTAEHLRDASPDR